jgi:hypothetical protein
MPAPQQAPFRQVFRAFPTPKMQDVVISVLMDTQRSRGDAGDRFPQKGDPCPLPEYPNHRFAHALAEEQNDGQIYKFFYIAEREDQLTYNFEYAKADTGRVPFDTVTRTFVSLREDFDPTTPTAGDAMENVPEDLFAGDFVLAERKEVRTDDPVIDSLFVIDEQVYIKRCTQRKIGVDSETGSTITRTTDIYYRGEEYSSGLTIEDAFETGSIFGVGGGSKVTGEQLSCNWFAVYTETLDGIDDWYVTSPSSANFSLPSVLTSVTGVWHEASGNADSSSDWRGLAVGRSRSLSGSESASVQASASLIPEIIPVIREYPSSRIPTTSHFFFEPMPVSLSDIMGRSGASAQWPVFKPESVTFILKGTKVAVLASASAQAAFSTGDNAVTGSVDMTKGKGESFDYSPVVNAVTLPPTLHGAISVTTPTHAAVNITAHAEAKWIGDAGGTLEESTGLPEWDTVNGFPSVTSEQDSVASATGSISPTSLTATVPTAIPTSGVYLVDSKVEPYDFGYAKVYAETVDASVFSLS